MYPYDHANSDTAIEVLETGVTSPALYGSSSAYTSPFKVPVGASLLAKGAVTSTRVLFASKLAPTPERAIGYALFS